MKITVHRFDSELPHSEPYTVIETWDELDPDVLRRYLMVGLTPTAPLTDLNDTLGPHISNDAEEGDGGQLAAQGGAGTARPAHQVSPEVKRDAVAVLDEPSRPLSLRLPGLG